MKKTVSLILAIFIFFGGLYSFASSDRQQNSGNSRNDVVLGSIGNPKSDATLDVDCSAGQHVDDDNDAFCDWCNKYVVVVIDFYALNDLHGKFCDSSSQGGVDELGTYFEMMSERDDNVVLLASGDMWQGSAESNLSRGRIITEWMNELGFTAMTLGNHDFDWGEGAIRDNLEVAEFPFLAINVYDRSTGKLADYCTPSIMVERQGIKIGIIGAIGDCYSSISKDKVSGVEFKVGGALTGLVRAEAKRLREAGADLIVYSIHDGHGSSSGGTGSIGNSDLQKYYSQSLSNGSVDLVFEAHTHQNYTLIDSYGVYHVQGGGENRGISHVEIAVNSANGNNRVTEAGYIRSSAYTGLEDHQPTEDIENRYADTIDKAYSVLGYTSKYYDDSVLEDKVAELYLEAGLEKWGDDYDIILGGGFLRTRSPYNLGKGQVTYATLLSLLPFDNEIVLCKISGDKLSSRFINNSSDDYHIFYSDYGNDNKNSISYNETYYVIVDTYTAFYAYNGLTIVEYLDYSTYARDLVAEAVKNGDL